MPYDPRTDDLLSRIQQEGSLTRSQARRVLRERIDVAKRAKLSDPDTAHLEIIAVSGENGVRFKKPQTKVTMENPFREHVESDHEANAKARAAKTREISPKQRAALEAGNRIRQIQHREARIDPEATHSPASGKPNGRKRSTRLPVPGSITAQIVGALRNPEADFNDAFITLRSRKQLAHVSDPKLRQRMREVAWRYDLRIWYRPSTLQQDETTPT
jgi:hypothetical protein